MSEIINITHWNPQDWFNTGGTRDKKYVQSPEGEYFYFKKSYKTPGGRDYFFEFWSEVIASKIGLLLGFDMLHYYPAIDGEEMGCISKSMIESEKEELVLGSDYLQAYENRFDPNIKEGRELYSFQLIEASLKKFEMGSYINRIIEIIIFDSIISNGDRHQENWAFINQNSLISESFSQIEKDFLRKDKTPPFLKNIFARIYDFDKKRMKPDGIRAKLSNQKTRCFAPIYDNGSSLGRELTEEKIDRMLENNVEFEAYLNRGESEIHWERNKLNHFEMIRNIMNAGYAEEVKKIVHRVVADFNPDKINSIIFDVDEMVPEPYGRYRLKEARKRLIFKLVTLRFEQLQSVVR